MIIQEDLGDQQLFQAYEEKRKISVMSTKNKRSS